MLDAVQDRRGHPDQAVVSGSYHTQERCPAGSAYRPFVEGDRYFAVRLRSLGEHVVCQPEGDLDTVTASQLRSCLASLVGRVPVVVDLAAVQFMDAAGLGALIGGIRRIRDAGGTVVVCTDGGGTARLLASAGFDRWVPVVHSLIEALSAQTWSLGSEALAGAL